MSYLDQKMLDTRMAEARVLFKGRVTLELSVAPDGAHFFIIKGLPGQVLANFASEPNLELRLCTFNRNCYQEMKDAMFSANFAFKNPWFIITGTSGIGKSYFFLYLLYCFLKNEFPGASSAVVSAAASVPNKTMKWSPDNKSFLYQIDADEVFFFYHKGGLLYDWYLLTKHQYGHISGVLSSAGVLFFSDMKPKAHPLMYASCQIIFSSFDEKRYHENEKLGTKLVMPVWSMDELEKLSHCHFFQEITNSAFPPNFIRKKYLLFGGSLRNIMIRSTSDINNAVSAAGKLLCENLFTAGFTGKKQEQADTLIHRNPGVDANGNFLYYSSEIVCSFASDLVFTKLYEKYRSDILAEARSRYVNGLSYGVQDGNIFETLSFLCFKLSGSHAVKSLANEEVITIVIPELMEILPINWKAGKNRKSAFIPKLNILYYPAYRNMDSGGGFYVSSKDGVTCLVIIQPTTGSTHPLKASGLSDIYAICTKLCNIDKKMLVFLTPPNPCLNAFQNLTTKSADVSLRVSQATVEFRTSQYLLVNQLCPKDAADISLFSEFISRYSVEAPNVEEDDCDEEIGEGSVRGEEGNIPKGLNEDLVHICAQAASEEKAIEVNESSLSSGAQGKV
jgi:hypothetical protein